MIVAAMRFPMEINSVVETAPNTYLLNVCDVRHAQKGFTVTIDNVNYKILSVNFPNEIVVTGPSIITATTFELYAPKYFHGTPLSMNVELDKKKQATDKTPMIWLKEQFTEDIDPNTIDPFDRDISFEIFFLSTGNRKDWTTDKAYEFGIDPMSRLQQAFEAQLMSMINLFMTEEPFHFKLANYHQFGVYIVNKGMPEALWVDDLAGVGMTVPSLKVYSDGLCKDNCGE
jgi:hypothetical protein